MLQDACSAQQNNFLQSEEWQHFQEATGRKTVRLEGEDFFGMGVIHSLPGAGKYLYFPRGPVLKISNDQFPISKLSQELVKEGKKEAARWIRVEPTTEEELARYQMAFGDRLKKAPHDMQPREILSMSIEPSEEILLEGMKSKTRYNIRLAEKKGVRTFASRDKKYQEAFLDLMTRTAERKSITPHPRAYYEKFFSALPETNLFLFVAEYQGSVVAANLVLLFGNTATYLHGGTADRYRDAMAPYFLQWEQIRFAKVQGMKRYDFGGIKTAGSADSWAGITRFKQGFAPRTVPVCFPGSYDIVLDRKRYAWYRMASFLLGLLASVKRSLS